MVDEGQTLLFLAKSATRKLSLTIHKDQAISAGKELRAVGPAGTRMGNGKKPGQHRLQSPGFARPDKRIARLQRTLR
jgi:hypothetical protein